MNQEQQPQANWKNPFFIMWTGQAISLLGSRVVQFALVWWLTRQTGSATVLATASLVDTIPAIVRIEENAGAAKPAAMPMGS